MRLLSNFLNYSKLFTNYKTGYTVLFPRKQPQKLRYSTLAVYRIPKTGFSNKFPCKSNNAYPKFNFGACTVKTNRNQAYSFWPFPYHCIKPTAVFVKACSFYLMVLFLVKNICCKYRSYRYRKQNAHTAHHRLHHFYHNHFQIE